MAKKLERPLVIGGNEAYPLTTADQIIMSDGSRLETENGVNADLLGGKDANEYALAEDNTIKTIAGASALGVSSTSTPAEVYTTIPANSIFFEQSSFFTDSSWNFPTKYCHLIIEKHSHHRASITLRDKTNANEWHMHLNSDGIPDGVWHRVAHSPFDFAIDANGNYGYIKVGADTVTPFKRVEYGNTSFKVDTDVKITLGFKPKVLFIVKQGNYPEVAFYDESISTNTFYQFRRGADTYVYKTATITSGSVGITSMTDDGFVYRSGNQTATGYWIAYV